MNLPPLDIRGLLHKHNLDPHKGLGQNFLVDDNALKLIVACAELQGQETVLEIGAGLGSLTRHLAARAGKVTAVEIDRKLVPVLTEVTARFANVEVRQGDILELDPAKLMPEDGYVVVANIPYYITSAIIRHLLESSRRPSRIVLTMQQEVAERICAEPGDLSVLAVSVQVFGRPRIAAHIPAAAFYPAPKVDSATLVVDIYPQSFMNQRQHDLFFTIVKMGFAQKRKMLRNTIAAGLHIPTDEASALLTRAGIDPTRRAQTLELVEWRTLAGEVENSAQK
ncbi:MAG TPA: 16S rRNA (adenine(1518)-N(6)/adenine(1519)-N(6))-dimethyltransferase RsmA [Anaerolineaceae bacterium]|nr:16S rRNA (adenine(1518)-N(6)/adenine(1519)-N(6))-dimethyltransferase RsmA [Anaerolineaceae bacterium]